MSVQNHPWCRDVSRDEAIRRAEDAAAADRTPLPDHRDLPAAVAELRERVAALEDHFADAGKMVTPSKPAPVPTADGLRTERVTLEFQVKGSPPNQWPWSYIISRSDAIKMRPGESVRVVEDRAGTDMGNGVFVASTDEVLAMCRETEARLTAERDAAREECERLKSRVAELEAPAANAGGEAKQEPVAWGVKDKTGKVVAASTLYAYAEAVSQSRLSPYQGAEVVGDAIPLYAAPQPPRGWLTSEERACIEELLPYTFSGVQAKRLTDLLARSTPPKVPRPMPWHFHAVESEDEENQTARDRQWEEAIREAGGEVQDG